MILLSKTTMIAIYPRTPALFRPRILGLTRIQRPSLAVEFVLSEAGRRALSLRSARGHVNASGLWIMAKSQPVQSPYKSEQREALMSEGERSGKVAIIFVLPSVNGIDLCTPHTTASQGFGSPDMGSHSVTFAFPPLLCCRVPPLGGILSVKEFRLMLPPYPPFP